MRLNWFLFHLDFLLLFLNLDLFCFFFFFLLFLFSQSSLLFFCKVFIIFCLFSFLFLFFFFFLFLLSLLLLLMMDLLGSVLKVKPCWKLEIKLYCTTLMLSIENIKQFNIDFRSIESSISFINFIFFSKLFQSLMKLSFCYLPIL